MTWNIEWDERAVRDLSKLDRQVQKRLVDFLRERIATQENPRRFGKALKGELGDLWRYRVGDYRIVCQIEDTRLVVFVIAVNHRSKIYR